MRNLTRFGTTEMSKIEVASLIVNHMIDDLVARATRGINVRDYYDIGVIGYSGYEAYSMLPGDDTVFKRVVRLVEDSPQPKFVSLNCQTVDGDIEPMGAIGSKYHLLRQAGEQFAGHFPAIVDLLCRRHGSRIPATAGIGAAIEG